MSVGVVPQQVTPLVKEDKATQQWWNWFRDIGLLFKSGFSGTVVLAKITGVGTNGSLTVVNGVITKYVAPT